MGFRFSNYKPMYNTYMTYRKSRFNNLIIISSLIEKQPINPHFAITKRGHVGHSHHQQQSGDAEQVFRLGLAADIALASGKALTGYLSGSTAIIADAVHSVSDVVLSGVALWSFKVARAPKDKEHPYGHGKFETLGALGISSMLLVTAGGIAWHAMDILLGLLASNPGMDSHGHSGGHHHGVDMDHPILAVSMMIISISVKEGLYWITKKAGEIEGSGLMKANAWHHRADAVSSVVALVGVGGSILGVKFLDPLAGLIVSGMIFKAGIETGHQSVMELVDTGVPQSILDPIKQTILRVEGIMGCHQLRGRRAGSSIYLDVHIENNNRLGLMLQVDPFLSVSAAHGIGENVRRQIQKLHAEVAEVFIHIDPAVSRLSPEIIDQQAKSKRYCRNLGFNSQQKDVEDIVSKVLSSKFPEVISVEHITHHSLQGQLLLQIEVSMPHDMLIRDAKNVAEEAEKEILKSASNLNLVSIQLRLGHPFR
ncbi:hypothetical protein IFM89_015835 [Coptis chinensis]|uniref:Cation efflux protein cytoplasmic domain-containing protein n=1 Tax=Coptis chinensis TaxID=261450 RepID=A0A835ISV0_9MAGN|nr:hypothetical protein IFM89_015835 [Coptis chinensis]